MTEQAIEVIEAIVLACIPIVVPFILNLLVQKAGKERFYKIQNYVSQAVEYAELVGAQVGWNGAAKKQQVVNALSKKFGLNADDLNRFIEQAVANLKRYGEEWISDGNGGAKLKNGDS